MVKVENDPREVRLFKYLEDHYGNKSVLEVVRGYNDDPNQKELALAALTALALRENGFGRALTGKEFFDAVGDMAEKYLS